MIKHIPIFIAIACLFFAHSLSAQEQTVASSAPSRFVPSAWTAVDLSACRLNKNLTDTGVLIRFWSFKSPTIHDGEDLFGPVIGIRTMGFGWIWRFKDSSFCLGAAAIVETALRQSWKQRHYTIKHRRCT